LCGEVHPLRIHGYVQRRVRNRELGCNETILIVVIRCETARAASKPYTMRLLPDFLVPGCVIRLDHVAEAHRERATGAGAGNEQLCAILGCLDDRTVRRHLKAYERALEAAALTLAEQRALSPELGDVPETTPDTPVRDRLERLWDAEQVARLRRGARDEPTTLRHLLQTTMRKSRRRKPSSCVSLTTRPP
jgi:hypothetical protein